MTSACVSTHFFVQPQTGVFQQFQLYENSVQRFTKRLERGCENFLPAFVLLNCLPLPGPCFAKQAKTRTSLFCIRTANGYMIKVCHNWYGVMFSRFLNHLSPLLRRRAPINWPLKSFHSVNQSFPSEGRMGFGGALLSMSCNNT